MGTRSSTGVRALLALGAGVLGFYAACVAYRGACHAFSSSLTHGGIVAHLFGADARALIGLGAYGERAFTNTGWMMAVGAVLGSGACAWTFALGGARASARTAVRGFAGVGLATLAALGVDLHQGLTPWSESALRSRGIVARGSAVERRLAVQEIRHLPDALSGSLAETEGVLAYHDGLRRFHLESPTEPGTYVKVFFFQRRRGGASEMRGDGPPRHADQLLPFVGRRVRLVGRVVNGQIDVELSDITPL